jgi:hypothetical protein
VPRVIDGKNAPPRDCDVNTTSHANPNKNALGILSIELPPRLNRRVRKAGIATARRFPTRVRLNLKVAVGASHFVIQGCISIRRSATRALIENAQLPIRGKCRSDGDKLKCRQRAEFLALQERLNREWIERAQCGSTESECIERRCD